jgi:WhiB family transcriptional regulator, redox-sensing transcriptional regulator
MTASIFSLPSPSRHWRDQAACLGADPDLFFPQRGESAEPAREICARCPVREACLDYALRNAITHGIWGGVSERERRALRTRRLPIMRRERDRAILAADAAGQTREAIGRAFGLTRMSVTRIVRNADDPGR